MKKIRYVSELPAWFELSNYDHLSGFDAQGWTMVLSELLAISQLDLTEAELAEEGIDLESLFAGAVVNSADRNLSDYLIRSYCPNPDRFDFRGVSSLSNSVVAYMCLMLETLPLGKKMIAFQRSWYKKRQGKPARNWSVSPELADFATRPFFLSLLPIEQGNLTPNRAVSVNMELPDVLLIEDFREWLRATRALDLHKAAQKAFSQVDFAKWTDDGYVPLLLLRMWAKLKGVDITYSTLAEAVFPKRRRISESNIRRSILPAAEAWRCYQTRDTLAAQAAKDSDRVLPTSSIA